MKCVLFFLIAYLAQGQGLIREEQAVEVNGVREVWRLVWKLPPKPACSPAPGWYTCPCSGFAFGEGGPLDLVRLRQGREVERLPLTPFFEGDAMFQRWDTVDKDMEDSDSPAFPAAVAKRPLVSLMKLADYDHDGKATEFYLHTSSGPCGHLLGVIVGVSSSKPRLHAFGTTLHPDKPLVLQKLEWDALLNARGPAHVVDWPCGDHGENKQFEVKLTPSPREIEVVKETYGCPRSETARPLKTEPQ